MFTSKRGKDLIKQFEGCRLQAYKPVSTEKYYTIGYGHYGADVSKDMVITQQQADSMLKTDIKKFEAKVDKYMNTYYFNQNQYDALVSFAFNVGSIDKLTSNGTRSIEKIRECFSLYNKAGGKVLQGLVRRREAELKLFNEAVKVDCVSSYYNAYKGTTCSIVDALKKVGERDCSLNHRTVIAHVNGIPDYRGTGAQNMLMLDMLKQGILRKA